MHRILALTILLSSQACSTQDAQIDQEPPSITVRSPEEMGIYPAGEALSIEVTIRENLELHTYSVQLLHPASQSTFTLQQQHTHVQEVRFEQAFPLPPAKGATYELVVQADDHEGNAQEIRRTFMTAP